MFTVDTWKEELANRADPLRAWLKRQSDETLPYLAYGGTLGTVLWPAITTALIGGDPMSVAIAMTNVAGGAGAGLIANQINRWKDEADTLTLDEVATWVATEAPTNPDLRQALDDVLAKLEALPTLTTALPADDRAWFSQILRQELEALGNLSRFEATLSGIGVIAQGDNTTAVGAIGEGATAINKLEGSFYNQPGQNVGEQTNIGEKVDKQIVINASDGTKIFIGEEDALVEMTAVERESNEGRYLQYLISESRYLRLHGISSGGRAVHIELDKIYISLRTSRQREALSDDELLHQEASLAPGERYRQASGRAMETAGASISINEALRQHQRLVILGDPGSGKTTLTRYLALTYARVRAEKDSQLVSERLNLPEDGYLPIRLELRHIGHFLKEHRPADDGTEGPTLLLDFLHQRLRNQQLDLPRNFFEPWLTEGRAVVLLDGLDEVADLKLRHRVARLVEAFVRLYRQCRYIVTSRVVGYEGPVRLQETFETTLIRDFTLIEVGQFLSTWQRLLAISRYGPGPTADSEAKRQSQQLIQAIKNNPRIRELAINPLLLTVIAMVHRDRVKLPDRRAELYQEAIDVLLGKWDEAKMVNSLSILPNDQPFDTGDKRLILQNLALHLHHAKQKEIEVGALRTWLEEQFANVVTQPRALPGVVDRFLRLIKERAGLLTARGEGVIAFSHLTFQEYLAAVAAANRPDYVNYLTARSADPWWREVILLAAGYLIALDRPKTSSLIRAIANRSTEPSPYHNLVLAAQCVRDVGESRVEQSLKDSIQKRLKQGVEKPPPVFSRWLKGVGTSGWIEGRSQAMNALVQAGAGYWHGPFGEPEWVKIPAGEFWYGKGAEAQKVHLPSYFIARVPISNAQYQLYIQDTDAERPAHWDDDQPPKGLESHPVVAITWYQALEYCTWLSEQLQHSGRWLDLRKQLGVTDPKQELALTLPTEQEWEKAARGHKDQRVYPWGDTFKATLCNSSELGLRRTTPVGIFPDGASPYGCLDMAGNVWEWCRTKYDTPDDNTIDRTNVLRVLRGGAFSNDGDNVRCSYRSWGSPDGRPTATPDFGWWCRPCF